LENKGLIKQRNDLFPQRTAAGNAALAKAESEIELAADLPGLLREGNPQAASGERFIENSRIRLNIITNLA